MLYLLDTNVLSEPARPEPDEHVTAWLSAQSSLDLAISVITLGEIRKGVVGLVPGPKRGRLEHWLTAQLPKRFRGRILSVDSNVALRWGVLSADARRAGRPLPVVDGLLLATAAVHDLTFVTRNASDCRDRGVPILDPWAA